MTDAAPVRVLIVDDMEDFRTLLKVTLEDEQGFEIVAEASNGNDAVEMCGSLQPDAVILDLMMPGSDGLDAIEKIKARCPRTKVVVLSNAGRSMVAESIARGADTFLDKQDAVFDIVTVLKHVLGRLSAS